MFASGSVKFRLHGSVEGSGKKSHSLFPDSQYLASVSLLPSLRISSLTMLILALSLWSPMHENWMQHVKPPPPSLVLMCDQVCLSLAVE